MFCQSCSHIFLSFCITPETDDERCIFEDRQGGGCNYMMGFL